MLAVRETPGDDVADKEVPPQKCFVRRARGATVSGQRVAMAFRLYIVWRSSASVSPTRTPLQVVRLGRKYCLILASPTTAQVDFS